MRKSPGVAPDFPPAYEVPPRRQVQSHAATKSGAGEELRLKCLMVVLFLPEGFSFFVGDFRLSPERVVIFVLFCTAISRLSRRAKKHAVVWVPSDYYAPAAGAWMILAATATGGFAGLKGSGIEAIEFVGAYYSFRYLLGPVDSSVRIVKFSCKLIILVVALALLDPLTGKLFTYEFVKGLTGYVKPSYESALAVQAEALFRDGFIRAMGPLEHSILFGAVCVWFGLLAAGTFTSSAFGWEIAAIALLGTWFSQARGPLLGYAIGFALEILYWVTPQFRARWKIIGSAVGVVLFAIFSLSGSPIATLMRLAGISLETGWYRQAIWDTAVPQVLHSPLFGLGLNGDWDWQSNAGLVSASVDAFWLNAAMRYGIPGSVLILMTLVGAFRLGAIDKSRFLSRYEQRLSVALGIVVTTAVFLGFTVHFWGTCWVLLGVFAGMRAHLAEAAILRSRAAYGA